MLLKSENAFLFVPSILKGRMSIKTRSKAKKENEMSATESKFDAVLTKMDAKMDDLLKAKAEQEVKLNSILQKLENLEISQKKTADDVKDLKQSYGLLEEQVTEVKSYIAEKASRMELTKLENKIDDLENRSKRNNIVIWGLREDAEKEYESLEFFLAHNFFGNHMGIEGIEVMRAHRTNVKERAAAAAKPRPIHVYLLRYTDKVKILKAAAKALKDKVFFESQIYISDDVSKSVRNDRAKLRKEYLKEIREKEDVEFAFIPWSIPAQILYKKVSATKLSSFKLPTDE